MARPVTAAAAESGEIKFWASDPEPLGEDDDQWAIELFANKTTYLLTLVYAGREAADSARKLLPSLLRDCTFIATVRS